MILDSLLKQAINNFEKKNLIKSIELFEKILEKEPNNSEIITNKATCLAELGRYEESIEQLEKVLNKNPDDFDGWYNKATTLYDMGKYEDALNGFNLALKISPKDTSALCNKANVSMKLGAYDFISKPSDPKGLKVPNLDIEILNNIGIVYAGEKQHYTSTSTFN